MKPGTTVMPPASTTSVPGPARFITSSFEPTATNLPWFTASAWA